MSRIKIKRDFHCLVQFAPNQSSQSIYCLNETKPHAKNSRNRTLRMINNTHSMSASQEESYQRTPTCLKLNLQYTFPSHPDMKGTFERKNCNVNFFVNNMLKAHLDSINPSHFLVCKKLGTRDSATFSCQEEKLLYKYIKR